MQIKKVVRPSTTELPSKTEKAGKGPLKQGPGRPPQELPKPKGR